MKISISKLKNARRSLKSYLKTKRSLKSYLKALTRAVVLTCTLLLPNFSAQPAHAAGPQPKSVSERAALVREALKQKLASEQTEPNDFSFAEVSLAQWGNWGNWNNWVNWNNWNNWRNWANWGNWANV